MQPRVGEAELDVGHPLGEPARGAVARPDRPLVLGRQAAGVEAQACEPRLGERMVVVARHQHDRAARQRAAELLEHRAGHLERVGKRALPQLDDVAQQDHPVGLADRGDERVALRALARDIVPGEAAEVQVRDNSGPHRGGMVSGR